ncbi:MAG: Exodeoxyribonuclease large subunit [Deltaproteobacteria bacterium]|nr:Exodeoxyribonuclease large subunit [Deltaproteobacteria bacterium]
MSSRSILTVSQLTSEIRSLLERSFENVWVEGEISNLRLPGSGHLYFTLKDEKAQIRGVMFRLQNRLLKFEPRDGLQVIGYGRVTVYEPRGDYQIILDYLEPKGLGALQLAFEQLKEKLAAEGLFDPARKRPIPHLPQRIGIVTSSTGAAIRDILHIIDRRFANVQVLLYPVRVQGQGAAQEIAQAIQALNQLPEVDVMIVGRGGGSLEDLWAFNEEIVARAISSSRIPVISAVGHEIDFTIADFVADLRASTPSAAAELVVRNKVELVQNLENLKRALLQSFRTMLEMQQEHLFSMRERLTDPRRRLSDQRIRLDDLSSRLAYSLNQGLRHQQDRFRLQRGSLLLLNPAKRLEEYSEKFAQVMRRLTVSLQRELRISRQRIEGVMGKLFTLSPLGVLERGYSITRLLPSHEIVRQAEDLEANSLVSVKVHRGEFTARVEGVFPEKGGDS